jgi:hypothetical protein
VLGELITDLALLGSLGLASACLYYSPCTFLLSCFFLTLRHLDAPLFLSFVRAWLDLSEPRAVALDTHLVFSCLGHIPLSISIFCSTAQNTAKWLPPTGAFGAACREETLRCLLQTSSPCC